MHPPLTSTASALNLAAIRRGGSIFTRWKAFNAGMNRNKWPESCVLRQGWFYTRCKVHPLLILTGSVLGYVLHLHITVTFVSCDKHLHSSVNKKMKLQEGCVNNQKSVNFLGWISLWLFAFHKCYNKHTTVWMSLMYPLKSPSAFQVDVPRPPTFIVFRLYFP